MSWFKKEEIPVPERHPELTVEAVDCSWCAAEQGLPPTESPDICPFHRNQMLEVAQERAARRRSKI